MLEEPPKFECSNKTYKYREKKYKRKEFFQTNKKYYNKNKYKRKFFKRNKFKGKSKANAPKKCKCWSYNEEVHYANECPKKKKTNINELELITDCEGINDNDSTYCLFDETLSNFDS